MRVVPVPVLFKGIKDLLSVGMDQIGPGLPQRVNDVVHEADLKKKLAGAGVSTNANMTMCDYIICSIFDHLQ